jgi:hypothetical protein
MTQVVPMKILYLRIYYSIIEPVASVLKGIAIEQNVSSTKDSSDSWHCPKCGGPMKVVERLTAAEIQLRSPPAVTVAA